MLRLLKIKIFNVFKFYKISRNELKYYLYKILILTKLLFIEIYHKLIYNQLVNNNINNNNNIINNNKIEEWITKREQSLHYLKQLQLKCSLNYFKKY